MVSPAGGFRFPPPGTLLPKIIVAFLTVAIFYQLLSSSAFTQVPAVHPVPASATGAAQKDWFEDAVRPRPDDDDDDVTPPQYLANPTPAPHAAAPAPTAPAEFRDRNKTFISYGATQCLPHFDAQLMRAAETRNSSCAKYAPFPAEESRRVAFASITTGKPEEAYQRAILSQMFHSAVHGSTTHVLCEQLSDGAWNKIAFLLNLVMNEMLKPEAERLEWVMWIDRDAIVLDSCRPLSSFVPPATADYDKINLITNNDAFGLNAGVFMFRVNQWSIDLFNTILAFRYFRPDVELQLAEQTALEKIIHEDKWKSGFVRVPWYWFNAYPDEDDSVKKYKDGLEPEDLEWFRARKGDFVVHFAGDDGRSGRMPQWLDMLQTLGNVWQAGSVQRDVTDEVKEYWKSWRDGSLSDAQISGETWTASDKSA